MPTPKELSIVLRCLLACALPAHYIMPRSYRFRGLSSYSKHSLLIPTLLVGVTKLHLSSLYPATTCVWQGALFPHCHFSSKNQGILLTKFTCTIIKKNETDLGQSTVVLGFVFLSAQLLVLCG